MKLPTITHKVKKGENLTSIAKKYGFPGSAWRSIYNAKYNKEFKKKNKDPNVIEPGSEVKIPIISKAKLDDGYWAIAGLVGDLENAISALDDIDRGIEKVKKAIKKGAVPDMNIVAGANGSILDAKVAAEAKYRKCLKDSKGSWSEAILKSCERDHKAMMDALDAVELHVYALSQAAKTRAALEVAMVDMVQRKLKEKRKLMTKFISGLWSVAGQLSGAAAESF